MTYIYYGEELYHHGILGQKWGIRRYQNYDGTLTSAGRRRIKNPTGTISENSTKTKNPTGTISENSDSSKVNKKVVATATLSAVTVAAAAVYVHQNSDAIGRVISKVKNVNVGDLSQKAVSKGKDYVSSALSGAKEGAEEAIKEAPKKATKAVVTGVVMNQTKKALDSVVGTEESAKIFQANDNKKIGKFWKVSPEDKEGVIHYGIIEYGRS